MQRVIARLLFAVLWLSSIAPAFAFVPPTAPIACHRPPLQEKAETPSAEMPGCHGMSGEMQHAHAGAPASESRSTIGKDECCNDHECCRHLDRTQSISLTAAVKLRPIDSTTAAAATLLASGYIAASPDRPSGRAPPLL